MGQNVDEIQPGSKKSYQDRRNKEGFYGYAVQTLGVYYKAKESVAQRTDKKATFRRRQPPQCNAYSF